MYHPEDNKGVAPHRGVTLMWLRKLKLMAVPAPAITNALPATNANNNAGEDMDLDGDVPNIPECHDNDKEKDKGKGKRKGKDKETETAAK